MKYKTVWIKVGIGFIIGIILIVFNILNVGIQEVLKIGNLQYFILIIIFLVFIGFISKNNTIWLSLTFFIFGFVYPLWLTHICNIFHNVCEETFLKFFIPLDSAGILQVLFMAVIFAVIGGLIGFMIKVIVRRKQIILIIVVLFFISIGTQPIFAGTWYKGDLHVHTGYSSRAGYDSDYTTPGDNCARETLNGVGYNISEIRDHLRDSGFVTGDGIWASITDHSYCLDSDEWNHIVSESGTYSGSYFEKDYLFMPSEELSVEEECAGLPDESTCLGDSVGHLGAHGISSFIESEGVELCPEWPDSDVAINNVNNDGGISIINHPYHPNWDWESLGIHGGSDWALDGDNQKIFFGEGQDASVYWDGSNLIFNTNETGGQSYAWFSNNVSALDYVTRTSIYDKSKGSALDYIKDADDLKTAGEIDHGKFYGYTTYEVTDYSKPEVVQECELGGDGEEVCKDVTVYPYTKTEEGVSLNSEIDVLRQAVFELKSRLDEVCQKDNSYSWC